MTPPTRFPVSAWRCCRLLPLVLSALLIGCGGPAGPPVPVDTALPDPAVPPVADPWALVQQAELAAPEVASDLRLQAAHLFLEQNQTDSARTALTQLQTVALTPSQALSLRVLQADLMTRSGEHARALAQLHGIAINSLADAMTQNRFRQTLLRSQLILGLPLEAVLSLVNHDRQLDGQNRLDNQQTLLEVLRDMPPLNLLLLQENSADPDLVGWISLANTLNVSNDDSLVLNLHDWRASYPNHPLHPSLLRAFTGMPEQFGALHAEQYRQIGLLLPLTSAYGDAGRAFRDGFIAAHTNDYAPNKPALRVYDIGGEPRQSRTYYRTAQAEGADFIVGPLGRTAVTQLLRSYRLQTPTLLLADIPPTRVAQHLYSFSLSPQNEARQAAKKAFADGHRYATVLAIDGEWGQRVAKAFITEWQNLGGVIAAAHTFPDGHADYGQLIANHLGLDKSRARHSNLEAVLGTNLQFTPRRNTAIDSIFLAANVDQARLFVPQLRFYQAHDLPIYTTFYAYHGTPNAAFDADLNGLIFSDIQWSDAWPRPPKLENEVPSDAVNDVVNDTETDEREMASAGSAGATDTTGTLAAAPIALSYADTSLARLYSLGWQSYQAMPWLASLRANAASRVHGEAMTIRVDASGTVMREPVWYQFVDGLARQTTPKHTANRQ